MTLDGLTLQAIVRELCCIVGARIEKILQPAREEVVLQLHTQDGRRRLVLCAEAGACRLHLTEQARPNPAVAPNFCMLLRKHLTGGHIAAVSQLGLERVARIDVDAKDELGAHVPLALVIEIMGKYSNIMLLREGVVLGSVKRVPPDLSSVRTVLPGVTYAPPPLGKHDPRALSQVSLADVLKNGRLLEQVQGLCPQSAAEITFRAIGREELPAPLSESTALRLAGVVKAFAEEAAERPRPCIQLDAQGMPVFFSPLPFKTYPAGRRREYPTVNAAVDAYYTLRENVRLLDQKRAALARALKKHIARVQKKLKLQLETLARAGELEKLNLYAELITANIYRVQRGMDELTAENYYTGGQETIPLDKTLSPAANAQKYFKRYNKLKTALEVAERQRAQYDDELRYLEGVDYAIQTAACPEDLADVRADLVKYGYLEPAQKKAPPREDPLARPLAFATSDGFRVFAGRNSRQNDALTLKVAGPEDIWFHAKNLPGAHVILFTGGRPPTDTALHECAVLAATLCRAKGGKVQVDYAPRKHVWKANGARPGNVLYEGQTSVMAEPDRALADRLRAEQ